MDEEEREQLTQLCLTIITEKDESRYVELVRELNELLRAKRTNAASDAQAKKKL
jgi:hypothetical protein